MKKVHGGGTYNPPGLYVGAVWPSFATSLSPIRHKRYCFEQFQPGTYESPVLDPAKLEGEPFWIGLSRARKRVAVVDVPKTNLTDGLNGIQITDYLTHDPEHRTPQTIPNSLLGELEARFGKHVFWKCDAHRRSAEQFRALVKHLKSRIQKKEELSSYLLKRGGWDCFLTVIAEAHCAGHHLWCVHDPKYPGHDPAIAKAIGDPLKQIYQAVDASIGRLLKEAGPDTHAFVLCSHGMGPHYGANYLFDEILWRLEGAGSTRKQASTQSRLLSSAKRVWRLLPHGVRESLFRKTRAKIVSDMSKRSCFPVPNNDTYAAIRVNVAGREPQGRIRRGAEFDQYCKSLIQDLMTFINLEDRKPVIRKVHFMRDLYPNDNVDHLPDLVIEWNRHIPTKAVYSPKTGKIEGVYESSRSGDHKMAGMFFATGPSIQPGPLKDPVSIMDFGPTFASFLGATLQGVDGKSFAPLISAR